MKITFVIWADSKLMNSDQKRFSTSGLWHTKWSSEISDFNFNVKEINSPLKNELGFDNLRRTCLTHLLDNLLKLLFLWFRLNQMNWRKIRKKILQKKIIIWHFYRSDILQFGTWIKSFQNIYVWRSFPNFHSVKLNLSMLWIGNSKSALLSNKAFPQNYLNFYIF